MKMYLSAENCFQLDKILKSFEVAYRSYVASKIFPRFPNKTIFERDLFHLKSSFEKNSVVNSRKLNLKLQDIINNKDNIYNALRYCNNCLMGQCYEKDHVLYLSQVIDFTLLYFDPYFFELSRNFTNIEQFVYLSINYQKIRNNLSHPASSKVFLEEAKEIISFISKLSHTINDDFFWFVSKYDINNYTETFFANLKSNPIAVHNLNEINSQHKKLLYRDKELNIIKELIIGTNENYRRCGSLVVYGYGGIGKTALVIEFINQLFKDIYDKKILTFFNFIIFFSSKEEVLSHSETTGDLYISEIRKQFNSYDELKKNLFNYLNIEDWSDIKYDKSQNGIIIIDNFETLGDVEKNKILDFIKNSPRNVGYIITSRNEERCEEKLYLQEFNEENFGIEFIDEYIEEHSLSIQLDYQIKKDLIEGTKGNTLILILALERINDGKNTIQGIISELNNISSQNVEIIADFMYKNSFDQTINELNKRNFKSIEMLRVISLYDEPVDLYAISTLTDLKIKDVETMCNFLATKLILNKTEELYSLNEFANKFIFIKFMPDPIELAKIDSKIKEHKINIRTNLERLNREKNGNPIMARIIEDWKPRNYIDEIAISEVFSLWRKSQSLLRLPNDKLKEGIKEIGEKFHSYELRTSHPYIRFQKARIYKLFLDKGIDRENTLEIINDYFEQTIYSVQYNYSYIRKTRSYASVLWIYGIFLNYDKKDYGAAIKYLEESKKIFQELKIMDQYYCKMIAELFRCYLKMFKGTGNRLYYDKARELFNDIKDKEVSNFNMIHFVNNLNYDLVHFGSKLA